MEILDRNLAKQMGSSTYFTNKVCTNGHLTYRYTQSGACSACVNGDRSAGSLSKKERKVKMLRDDISRFEFKIKNALEIIAKLEVEIVDEREKFKIELAERKRILEADLKRAAEAKKAKIDNLLAQRRENQALKQISKLTGNERKLILSTFIKFKEPIHFQHVSRAKALLFAYTMTRNPDITIENVWLSDSPKFGVVYTMLAHPDDVEEIRSQLRQWYSNDANIDKIRDDIINNKILNGNVR